VILSVIWTFFLWSHRMILSVIWTFFLWSHRMILSVIWVCDVKHIMMLPIKTWVAVLKVSSYIITSIAVSDDFCLNLHTSSLVSQWVMISVSTFKAHPIL
jgi:hypothetical protein